MEECRRNFWCGPYVQHIKGMVSSSPGQAQLHVNAQAEEDCQVQPVQVLWEHCNQQQRSQGGCLGTLPAKQAGFSQGAIWSPAAGQTQSRMLLQVIQQGMTGDLQGEVN